MHINFFRLSLFENLTILCINKKPKPFSNKRALKKFKKGIYDLSKIMSFPIFLYHISS